MIHLFNIYTKFPNMLYLHKILTILLLAYQANTETLPTTTTTLLADPLLAQFNNCDYFQPILANQSYDIFSPGYDGANPYAPNTTCRWTAVAPRGHRLFLNCNNVYIPSSDDCQMDRIEISLRGKQDLTDAKRYCGAGSFVTESKRNKLVLALRVPQQSNGGYFRCSLSALRIPPGTSQFCDCGRRTRTRIVGGTETGINEFPMMAGIIDLLMRGVFCGATIIARNFAVSAAHCLPNQNSSELALLVGDHNYELRNDSRFSALYGLSNIIIHPRYSANPTENDIALLRTSTLMAFNEGVGAVCLPFRYAMWQESFVNQPVEATGWGSIEFGGPVSPYLQKVTLNVVTNQRCAQDYTDAITPAQICTYRPNRDTCQFDSGGPLLYTDPNSNFLYLVGVISYGRGCASPNPGVNTRVTSYVGWIQSNTPGVLYCYQ